MAAAVIVIDQSGKPAGVAGESRSDLDLSTPVTFSNDDDTGVRLWRWALIGKPPGSTATLTSSTNPTTTLTPDIEGSYLVELQVNGGIGGEKQRRIAAVLDSNGFRYPAPGEGDEFNEGGNTDGYAPALDNIIRTNASGGGAGPSDDSSQVKTTLAAISNQSIAAPLGFWNLDLSLDDEVTGGASDNLGQGFDGISTWELIQGVPGGADEYYAAWFDGASSAEADFGGNPTSKWNLAADLTVACWVKFDSYNAEGGENDAYVVVAFANRSSTTLGSTTSPPYQLYFNARIPDGTGVAPSCNYYEDGTATAVGPLQWDDADAPRAIKTPLGKWMHICMTRVQNAADDNDMFLYVNGELVDSITGQIDANLPNSANNVLQIGQGRGGTQGFCGAIRDVGIWDELLPAGDVQKLYQIGIGELS